MILRGWDSANLFAILMLPTVRGSIFWLEAQIVTAEHAMCITETSHVAFRLLDSKMNEAITFRDFSVMIAHTVVVDFLTIVGELYR